MASSDIDLRAEERAVIIQSANIYAERARSLAADVSSRVANAITVSEVREWAAGLGIYIRVGKVMVEAKRGVEVEAPLGLYLEYGVKPHSIDARTEPYLMFMGTNEFEGKLIKTRHVDHPGVEGKHFMKKAREEVRPIISSTLKEAVHRCVSSVIRTAWSGRY